jgi:hypothetical protein
LSTRRRACYHQQY